MDTTRILRFHFNNLWNNHEDRFNESLNYIKDEYCNNERFFIANKFTNGIVSLLTAKNLQTLAVKIISALDAIEELNTSLNLTFVYLYKSSFDSLRRALEITVIGQYFELIDDNAENVENWINSESDTPSCKQKLTMQENGK